MSVWRSKHQVGNYLPHLVRVGDGAQLFFTWRADSVVVLTESRELAIWWRSTEPVHAGEGSMIEVLSAWPSQGRDGKHWLMLTDRPGQMTWLWSPRGWLTRREFRAELAATLDGWKVER